MTRWYRFDPADAGTFETASQVYRFPVRLPVPPPRVWESLASDESLAAWGLGLRRLTWTSDRPFGVGTTREVVLPLGSMTVRERFFRWDEGSGYSFYVAEANRPGIRQFAEDYVVEPDGDGALLTWTIAIEARSRLAPLMRVLGPVNKMAFGQFATGARKYFTQADVAR
ncbi:MAG: hypothetical protein QOI74_691 [Micromonosporaceae bacterium]|jgi:hypothetical protein|nr:hypothetical protein [Micromonosporaceae bacterium]